ncbi:ultraviolet-B receptor UVR8 [Punica granatum]|uniref:Ultraviolet-B receptor UVR8 n=1 Tax=Punica granatum TaxID=22663 RepID=A0A6P8BW96_PUNGR|nr:ultraviolet-B receptor UVR8 [Punica granatum]
MEDPEVTQVSTDLDRKVTAIATGEAHTLALSGGGSVNSWGRGMFGRLGNGSENDKPIPVQVDFGFSEEKRLKFVGIAAGSYHSLALADDGSVWCWGYNIYGQLGSNGENTPVPHLMNSFNKLDSSSSPGHDSERETKAPLKICLVRAGGMMSLAVDNFGALWMWGNCPQPESTNNGQFSLVSTPTPIPVWDFHGHTVVKVACGNEHVVALVSEGEIYKGDDLLCYSWGSNSHGQLGLGDKESRARPEIVQTFSSDSQWTVYEVACGAFHTALLTHRKRPSDTLQSLCWTFGLGENGQLGHGTTQSSLVPEPVKELPDYVYLASVDCGLFHTSVVSTAGQLWSWGMEKGLGLCPEASFTGPETGDAVSPVLIPCGGPRGPKFEDPVQVACGAAHTVLVTNDGYRIWAWGRGRSGVLGNGKTIDFFTPTLVLWPPTAEEFNDEPTPPQKEDNKASSENATEMDQKLVSAMEEISLLRSKLSSMERYASILHGAIFGRPFEESDIPSSLEGSGGFDITREWESMLESADRGKLVRLEMFYRNMLAGVKDKLMKKRIEELIKDCLRRSGPGN